MPINETHDPNLKSWVESANDPETDFPIQNLPLCVFYGPGEGPEEGEAARPGVLIGDRVLDLAACAEARLFNEIDAGDDAKHMPFVFGVNHLYGLLHLSAQARSALRQRLVHLLRHDNHSLRDNPHLLVDALFYTKDVTFDVPVEPGDYTDFYASIHHASTVGSMFRPDNPLLPNYKHIPIGYHGRASSIVASGTNIRRPHGQQAPPDDNPGAGPSYGPCRMLDYELEVGFFVGPGNDLGQPVDIEHAEEHIFGLCLVNDWSARDVQKWEYQPLGPFLSKSFATTVSPYIVTLEALEPFRCPAYQRPDGDPRPLPYLFSKRDQERGGIDLTLEVHLLTEEMRRRGMSPVVLSKSKAFREMYWTIAQMLTHHASNGCNMQPGDLLASGTVSGREPGERGCLLELTWQGRGPDGKPLARKPIELPSGETRLFLQDGDEVILKGYCQRDGFRRIGFGECRGRIAPEVE